MVIYCRSVAMLVHSGRLFNDDPSPSLHTCIHPHVGADIHTLTFVSKNTAPHPFLHSHINAHKLNTTHSWVSLTMACIIYGLSVSDMRPKQMNWGGGWILTCPQLKDPATAFDALCRSDSGVGFGKSQFSPDARGALLRQTGVYLEPACFLCIYFSTVLFRWPGNERTYKTLKSLMPHRVKRHVLLKLGLSYVPRTHCIYDFRKGSVAVEGHANTIRVPWL